MLYYRGCNFRGLKPSVPQKYAYLLRGFTSISYLLGVLIQNKIAILTKVAILFYAKKCWKCLKYGLFPTLFLVFVQIGVWGGY